MRFLSATWTLEPQLSKDCLPCKFEQRSHSAGRDCSTCRSVERRSGGRCLDELLGFPPRSHKSCGVFLVLVEGHWTCALTYVLVRQVSLRLLNLDCRYPRDLLQPARKKNVQRVGSTTVRPSLLRNLLSSSIGNAEK